MAENDRYGVRIRLPDDATQDAAGDLGAMIAPIIGQPAGDLAAALERGSVVVAQRLSLAEAEQLAAVFGSLGATAELVEPESRGPVGSETRPLFGSQDDTPLSDAWRRVVTHGRFRLDAGSAPPERVDPGPTLAFDSAEVREAVREQADRDPAGFAPTVAVPRTTVPPVTGTQPFEAVVLGPAAGPAETQPFDARQLRASLARGEGPSSETRPLTPLPGAVVRARALLPPPAAGGTDATQRLEVPPGALDAVAPTVPVDAAALAEALRSPPEAEAGGDAVTRRFDPIRGDDDLDRLETRPINADGPTLELRNVPGRGGDAPTQPRDAATGSLSEPTRKYQRPAVAARTTPQPGIPRDVVAAEADTLADTPTRELHRESEALQTGNLGSVQGGPLIFQLDAPPALPTETGSVPTPVQLLPTGQIPRVEAPREAPDARFAPAPARPGVYKLPAGRTTLPPPEAKAERVVAIAAPASAERPDERIRSSGSFEVVRPDGTSTLLAPARKPRPEAPRPPPVHHSPARAALLSVVLPGMGQVYNGERDRGVWFALGALLVAPWIYSVVDAWTTARAIADGSRAGPDPAGQRGAVTSQLALNLSVAFGVVVGVFLWYRLQHPPPSGASLAAAQPAVAAEDGPDAGAVVAGEPDAGEPDAAEPPRDRPPLGDDLAVPDLMRKGRMACGRGLYAECEEIMHAILRLDPNHRDARTLLVEAVSKRQRTAPVPPPVAPDPGIEARDAQ